MTMTTTQEPSADDVAGTTAVAIFDAEQAALAHEHLLATGDLAQFTPKMRVSFYLELCRVLGLDSLSRPFDWLVLDEKLVLYPNKSCTEQLRRRFGISVKVTRRDIVGDLFVCEVEGWTPDGRVDAASKYVPLTAYSAKRGTSYRLTGKDLANAFAKAETGAKRRLTLSMVGLAGLPDLDEAKHVRFVTIDGSGNVIDRPTAEQKYLAEHPAAARVINEPTFETTTSADESPIQGDVRAPSDEDLEPRRRTTKRQSFRPDEEEVRRRCGAWFAIVKDTSLDNDDARHKYVREWTASRNWPKGRQTESVRTFFARATEDESAVFLAELRKLTDEEKSVKVPKIEQAALDDDDDGAFEPEPF